MFDRRVVRGNTHAKLGLNYKPPVGPNSPLRTAAQSRDATATSSLARSQRVSSARNTQTLNSKPQTPVATQSHLYLESLSMEEKEEAAPVEANDELFYANDVKFAPLPAGGTQGTQVGDEDLVDFNLTVEPVLEVLVGKSLQEAVREVLQEQEVKRIVRFQKAWQAKRNLELNTVQRMAARDLRSEKEKMHAQADLAKRREIAAYMEKTEASKQVSRQFLQQLEQKVYQDITNAPDVLYDPVLREVESAFMPWLQSRVASQIEQRRQVRAWVDAVVDDAASRFSDEIGEFEAAALLRTSSLAYGVLTGSVVARSLDAFFTLKEDEEGRVAPEPGAAVPPTVVVLPPQLGLAEKSISLRDADLLFQRKLRHSEPTSREVLSGLEKAVAKLMKAAAAALPASAATSQSSSSSSSAPTTSSSTSSLTSSSSSSSSSAGDTSGSSPSSSVPPLSFAAIASPSTSSVSAAPLDHAQVLPARAKVERVERFAFDLTQPAAFRNDLRAVSDYLRHSQMREQFEADALSAAAALEIVDSLTPDLGFAVAPIGYNRAANGLPPSALRKRPRVRSGLAKPVTFKSAPLSPSAATVGPPSPMSRIASPPPVDPAQLAAEEAERAAAEQRAAETARSAAERAAYLLRGVCVTSVSRLGSGIRASLTKGDIIFGVNDLAVDNVAGWTSALASIKPRVGDTLQLKVRRQLDEREEVLTLLVGAAGNLFSPAELRSLRGLAQLPVSDQPLWSEAEAQAEFWRLRGVIDCTVADVDDKSDAARMQLRRARSQASTATTSVPADDDEEEDDEKAAEMRAQAEAAQAALAAAKSARGVMVVALPAQTTPGAGSSAFRLMERIVTVDGVAINSALEFLQIIGSKLPGDRVELMVDEWNVESVKEKRTQLEREWEEAKAEREKRNKRRAKKNMAPEPEPRRDPATVFPQLVQRSVVIGGTDRPYPPEPESVPEPALDPVSADGTAADPVTSATSLAPSATASASGSAAPSATVSRAPSSTGTAPEVAPAELLPTAPASGAEQRPESSENDTRAPSQLQSDKSEERPSEEESQRSDNNGDMRGESVAEVTAPAAALIDLGLKSLEWIACLRRLAGFSLAESVSRPENAALPDDMIEPRLLAVRKAQEAEAEAQRLAELQAAEEAAQAAAALAAKEAAEALAAEQAELAQTADGDAEGVSEPAFETNQELEALEEEAE